MSPDTFLQQLITEQSIGSNSSELLLLLREHARIESLLKSKLPNAKPLVEVGGSLAKGTLVRSAYDLDTICYFDNDDDGAGSTLKEIRQSVEDVLRTEYRTEAKRSAIRLTARKSGELDFSVDVIPGRYVDKERQDVFLYQADGGKDRLKTNLHKHISHISQSGQVDLIQLAKIWKLRADLKIKTFVLELLVVECMRAAKTPGLSFRLLSLWKAFRDDIDSVVITDPANPPGNDLSSVFGDDEKEALTAASTIALDLVESDDWEALFGHLGKAELFADRALVSPAALLALGDTSHAQQHNWPVHRGPHQVSIVCRASSRRGTSFDVKSDGSVVTDEARLRFEASTNVPAPFQVRWQVVNTGAHAKELNDLRGGFIQAKTNEGDPTSGLVHRESAMYTGKHWIECFILKDGALWARSGRFYVNIISRKRRHTPWPWRRKR